MNDYYVIYVSSIPNLLSVLKKTYLKVSEGEVLIHVNVVLIKVRRDENYSTARIRF